MKYSFNALCFAAFYVASLAEAWIEISRIAINTPPISVASLAEAWIEMKLDELQSMADESPPSRRRGLKSTGPQLAIAIELGRLPRGGVD